MSLISIFILYGIYNKLFLKKMGDPENPTATEVVKSLFDPLAELKNDGNLIVKNLGLTGLLDSSKKTGATGATGATGSTGQTGAAAQKGQPGTPGLTQAQENEKNLKDIKNAVGAEILRDLKEEYIKKKGVIQKRIQEFIVEYDNQKEEGGPIRKAQEKILEHILGSIDTNIQDILIQQNLDDMFVKQMMTIFMSKPVIMSMIKSFKDSRPLPFGRTIKNFMDFLQIQIKGEITKPIQQNPPNPPKKISGGEVGDKQESTVSTQVPPAPPIRALADKASAAALAALPPAPLIAATAAQKALSATQPKAPTATAAPVKTSGEKCLLIHDNLIERYAQITPAVILDAVVEQVKETVDKGEVQTDLKKAIQEKNKKLIDSLFNVFLQPNNDYIVKVFFSHFLTYISEKSPKLRSDFQVMTLGYEQPTTKGGKLFRKRKTMKKRKVQKPFRKQTKTHRGIKKGKHNF